MERSMLSDIPAHQFQAILDHLSCQDYASLRQVSRSVAQLTTQHVPYITLRLSCTSSSDQLQKWSHATRQLQHVNSVHIHVVDSVKDHVFESAVQLLSHPARVIKELHLIGVTFGNGRHCPDSRLFDDPAAGCKPAFVPTLLPLQQLMGRLQTLVVNGIVVRDAPRDFKQWAAAAATGPGLWQLQSLTWNVPQACSYSLSTSKAFISVTQNLTGAFPQLRQLSISVPSLENRSSSYPYATIDKAHQREQLSTVQALATGVMQLKRLQAVTVTGLPDIWQEAVHEEIMDLIAASEGVAVQPAAPMTTLDDYGCWLLQHHSQLKEVQISTDYTGVCMSWQKQHMVGCSSDVSGSSTCSADIDAATASTATLLSINASVDLQYCYLTVLHATHSSSQLHASPSTDADSNKPTRLEDISSCVIRQLSRYSTRAYVDIWSRMNSLSLVLNEIDVDSLADILDNMKSLKHFEVAVRSYSIYTADRFHPDDVHRPTPLSELMAAVAGIKGLHSVIVHVQFASSRQVVAQLLATDTLLLPLTAAAGGPGSSLKRLVLSGVFVEPTATTPAQVEPVTVAASSNTAAGESAAATTVEPGDPCRWFSVLRQLDGLQELTINHGGDEQLLEVSVDSLPASLKVFKGRQLNITCAAHHVGEWSASAGDNCSSGSEEVLLLGAHNHRPMLQVLDLRRCRLCDPYSLASEQLQQLTVIRSSWPGAWAAAATAWPNIQKITWKYDSHFTTTDGVTSSNSSMKEFFDELTRCNDAREVQDAMAGLAKEDSGIAKADSLISMMLQDIFVCFKHLTTLSILYLPWLSAEILQPVVHHMQQLRYAQLNCIHHWYMILHDAREHAIWKLQYANDRSRRHSYRPQPDHSDEEAMRQFAAHALPFASLRVSHVHVDYWSYGLF